MRARACSSGCGVGAFAFIVAIALGGCWQSERGADRAEPRDAATAERGDDASVKRGSGAGGRGAGGTDVGVADASSEADAAEAERDAGDPCAVVPDSNGVAEAFSEVRLGRPVSGYEVRHPVVLVLAEDRVVIGYHLSGEGVLEPGLYLSRQRPDGGFDEELVAAGAERDGHAFATAGGKVVVASYFVDGDLHIARDSETGWERFAFVNPAEPAEVLRSAIAVDADGHVHVAHVAGEHLYYTTHRGGPWRDELVSSGPSFTQIGLAVDSSRAPHITYQIEGEDGLRHAVGPEPFRISDVTLEPVDAHALALDAEDHAHVGSIRYDASGSTLRHAHNASGTWSMETLRAPDGPLGGRPDLVFDRGGNAHMAAFSGPGLIYFVRRSGTWSSQSVPASPGVNVPPTIAVDAAGAVHIVSTAFRYPNATAVHYYTNRIVAGDAGASSCERARSNAER